jgi:OTU domain-containing protein 6
MESLETMLTRHRKEQRDLQSRITGKKKNATKKTRKFVNDECAELERQLKDKQAEEIVSLTGDPTAENAVSEEPDSETRQGSGENTKLAEGYPHVDEVAAQLESANLCEVPAPLSQPKKRNRQKERLARRAAEQEAEAIKAEEAVSTMIDYRKLERTYMLKEFASNSLKEEDIRPDGHCLFSAIADQLQEKGVSVRASLDQSKEGEPLPLYRIIRRAAASYMETHPDDFAPFLEEPLKTYVARIRDTAEWGGQLELVALANTYNVEIRVVQEGRTETIAPSRTEAESELEKIWLAYYKHGYGLGEHYNSLRKAP